MYLLIAFMQIQKKKTRERKRRSWTKSEPLGEATVPKSEPLGEATVPKPRKKAIV